MKKILLSVLLIASVFRLCAQVNPKTDPTVTKSFPGSVIKNVVSETSGGNITVTGIDGTEARVEVFVLPNNNKKDDPVPAAEIKDRMDKDYTLTLTVEGNKLIATAKAIDRKMDWRKSLNFSFKIYVPKNVSTDLSTSGGNITLSDLSGNLVFSTSGGNLNLDKVGGMVKGTTSGGNIKIENSKDIMDLRTSGGNIHANKCNGKMKLVTSGGSLTLSNLNGNIDARTSGGNVNGSDIEGDLEAHTSGGNVMLNSLSCNLVTSTSGGNIHIEIKNLRTSIDVSNSGGHTDLIIPAGKGADLKLSAEKIITEKLQNFNGTLEDDAVKGKLNGGGTTITVKGGDKLYLGFAKQ
jgi:hypothetical protein